MIQGFQGFQGIMLSKERKPAAAAFRYNMWLGRLGPGKSVPEKISQTLCKWSSGHFVVKNLWTTSEANWFLNSLISLGHVLPLSWHIWEPEKDCKQRKLRKWFERWLVAFQGKSPLGKCNRQKELENWKGLKLKDYTWQRNPEYCKHVQLLHPTLLRTV